ncbi:unnamed protein product, partial [Rotaria sp. Silwood1]
MSSLRMSEEDHGIELQNK